MVRSSAYFRSKAAVTERETWYHLLAANEDVIEQADGKLEGSRVPEFYLTPAVSKTIS